MSNQGNFTLKQKKYRVGAIGHTGAGNFGHGLHTAYQGLDNIDFVSIADPDTDGRNKAVSETGAQSSYADYQHMLSQESLDIVSVCPRWTTERLDMVLACLEAGCHIYCEKPVALSLSDGDQMVELAEKRGLKVAVAHQAVYLPRIQQLKSLLNEGIIGSVETVYATGKQDHRGGGEDMIVLGTHLFNMMRYFCGDVAWMSAHVTENGAEVTSNHARQAGEPVGSIAGDRIHSYFAFRNGISGFFQSIKGRGSGENTYGIDFVGSEGRISLLGGAGDALTLYPHRYFMPSNSDQEWETIDLEVNPLMSGNRLAIENLISAIENDTQPTSSLADGVAALEMIHATYRGQLTKERIVFPLADRSHPLD